MAVTAKDANALIEQANKKVLEDISSAHSLLVGMAAAGEKIPFLRRRALLHSGPPLKWEQMRPPMRSAACGAAVYEGWAADVEEAHWLLESGEIALGATNDNGAIAPMAGIISPSMPVWVLQNSRFENQVFSNVNEGLGKTLRFGSNDEGVIRRLKWMEKVLGPLFGEALKLSGPIDITEMMARGIQRGDECHNRNKATNSLFIRAVAKWLVQTSFERKDIADTLAFMDDNDHFFLNLSMAANKALTDPVVEVPHSTLVTTMASNGVDFGIKVAGPGDRWFLGPAKPAVGNYFKGFTADDAAPIMGDSYISETVGIGAFALAAAPGISSFIGVKVKDTVEIMMGMYDITAGESKEFLVPCLEFRGTPFGIDIRKVLEKNRLPVLNAGIAHKEAGKGQVGAGMAAPSMECFAKAAEAMGLL